jgi:hemolysin activation/secretion protein
MCLTSGLSAISICLSFFLLGAFAPALAADNSGEEIQRRQATQLEQAQSKLQVQPDNLSISPAPGDSTQVVIPESTCFTLTSFVWQNAQAFPWLVAKSNNFLGQCLGAQSLSRLRDYLTLALLERGYITSRVIYPEQNLNQGVLTLQLIPGRLNAVSHKGNPIGKTRFPLAVREGGLLNQRALDQSIENFRRLPSQADTRFEVTPGAALGESDLQISHGQARRWQASIGLDDAGSDSTGKYQLSANLSIDSPLKIYDSLTLTYNNNANYNNQTLGNHASGVQWSVPLGYASAFLGINQSDYKQTVAGFVAPIEYTGESQSYEIGAGYTPYRTSGYKGLTQLKVFRKISHNFIDGVAIDVQARDSVGWEVSHQHKRLQGQWTTSLNIAMRASLPGHSDNVGVLIGEPNWDGYYRLAVLNLNVGRSFSIRQKSLRYQAQLRWQHSDTSLPPSEYASIGGRYSVRGFDGESTLSAEMGGYWRNELGLSLANRQEAYSALDVGRVEGKQSEGLSQKNLAGVALGLRGNIRRLNYDLSIGWPIIKPSSFAPHPALAGTLNFEI